MKNLSILIIVLIIVLIAALIIIPNRHSIFSGPSKEPTSSPSATPHISGDPEKTPSSIEKDKEISFKDPYLEGLVREILKKPVGNIFLSEVSAIKEIEAPVYGIQHLDDLVYFSSLERLNLRGNKINDISALEGLVNLKYLDLSHNFSALSIQSGEGLNLNPLKSLTRLEELYLDKNYITNISPLANLVSLRKLSLKQNRLKDISPLERLVKLDTLDLSVNYHLEDNEPKAIADIEVLRKLVLLEKLDINDNMISNLSPLEALPKLKVLYAPNNKIVSIDCFFENESIEELDVEFNIILDFKVILTMPSLKVLYYEGNPIADYEPIDLFEESKNDDSDNGNFNNNPEIV